MPYKHTMLRKMHVKHLSKYGKIVFSIKHFSLQGTRRRSEKRALDYFFCMQYVWTRWNKRCTIRCFYHWDLFFFSPSAAGIKMRLSHKIDKANVERMEKNRQFLYMWNVDFHFIAIVWIGLNTYWYCHLLFSLLSICMHSFRFLCQHTFSRTFERPHQKKTPTYRERLGQVSFVARKFWVPMKWVNWNH